MHYSLIFVLKTVYFLETTTTYISFLSMLEIAWWIKVIYTQHLKYNKQFWLVCVYNVAEILDRMFVTCVFYML